MNTTSEIGTLQNLTTKLLTEEGTIQELRDVILNYHPRNKIS